MSTLPPRCLAMLFLLTCSWQAHAQPALGQGVMAGEVTANSVVLQARLTDGMELIDGDHFDDGDPMRDGDLPECDGFVQFILLADQIFTDDAVIESTPPIRALAEHDYIVRHEFTGLEPDTRYYCIALCGSDEDSLDAKTLSTFRTLAGEDIAAATRLHVVTGMNYEKFFAPDGYTGDDRDRGYPALDAMLALEPDLLVFTGDDVYYDKPPHAQTLEDLRAKWHRQLALPRMRELLAAVPAYWMKDDHDFRDNDSDLTGDAFPPAELGIATFREQVPIVAQGDDDSPTYRTHRVSADLQVWLLEGRDYRDANRDEDGPGKSLWGEAQRDWLMRTLLESDATFKLIISPTPLLGPDDAYKRDNHANPRGFRHEGEAFLAWAEDHGLWDGGLSIVCGDRHWQYHSVHPSGAQEFSCGAVCDANSRLGRRPGDPNSTDPDGLLAQPYRQPEASGGFLSVVVTPAGAGTAEAAIRFEFYDERGERLYAYPEAD